MTVLRRGSFYMDAFPKSYPGYYDPKDRWNGWMCPYFERRELDKIVDYMFSEKYCRKFEKSLGPDNYDEQIDVVRYDPNTDTYMVACQVWDGYKWVSYNDPGSEPEYIDAWGEGQDLMTQDGIKHLYYFGGGWYTWSLADGDPGAPPVYKPIFGRR